MKRCDSAELRLDLLSLLVRAGVSHEVAWDIRRRLTLVDMAELIEVLRKVVTP